MRRQYPLDWPTGQARTFFGDRDSGNRFGRRLTVADAVRTLLYELDRLGVSRDDVVISTNIPTRLDGLPRSDFNPPDPGVAVWFLRNDRETAIACDRYARVQANMRAIALTLEALRAIERHGSEGLLEQALRGFAALPAAIAIRPKWWEILGFGSPPVELAAAEDRYRDLVHECHPDKGGDAERMAMVNDAIREARERLS